MLNKKIRQTMKILAIILIVIILGCSFSNIPEADSFILPEKNNYMDIIIISLLILTCIIQIIAFITEKKSRNSSDKATDLQAIVKQNKTLCQESQTIIKALPVGIAIYDKNARQEYINDAVAILFGITDKETHLAKHISLYDDSGIPKEIKEKIRQGEDADATIEYDLTKATKTNYFDTHFSHKMHIDGKVRYVKNEQGEIEKYILILNDITHEHNRKLQLERSELYLKLALESGGVSVWCYDIEKAVFHSLHGTMLVHEGEGIEEARSIMHNDYKDSFVATMNDLLSGKIKEAVYSDRIVDGTGRDKYYKTHIISVYSSTGKLETLLGSHKDITDSYYHELELEESILKARLAIKASNITQWDYDCTTRQFHTLNNPMGKDKESITSDEFLRLVHPEDMETALRINQSMQERRDIEFNQDIRMKIPGNDQWQYVTIDGAPIKDSKGKVIKFTGFRRNNTKFILLNEQLREKNIHLNMVLRAGDIIPTVLDIETDLIYVSSEGETEALIDINGVPFETLILNVHPDNREYIRKIFDDLKNGVTKTTRGECRYDSKRVFEKTFEINYMGIDYDKNEKPQKIVGYLQNITERKKAENRIKKQKELMNNIFDKIPIPIHIKDMEDGKYIYWNEESRKTFGEGLHQTAKSILGEERAKEIEIIDRKIFETEEPYTNNEKIKKLDGVEYETIVYKSIVYEGNKKLLLIVRWDVSLKYELQRKSKILSISINALQAFTWYYDLRDRILRFGNEFEKIGVNISEMNSMWKFAQRIHPDHRERFLTFMDNFCEQDGGEFVVEYEIDLKNTGDYEWWESRGTMEIVNEGNSSYKYLYGMDINIDNHKKSELAILKNKTELDILNKQNETILNNTNSGLVFLNNDYKVQWENLSSFLPDHPITKNYKQGVFCYKARGFQQPCPDCVVERSQNSGNIETKEVLFKNIVGELTAVPIFNTTQERTGTVLKVVDITEKKRIQVELEAAKNKAETASMLMKNIIDRLPCILFIKDVTDNYRHILVNQYFCNVLGRTEQEIIGFTDYDLFPTLQEADRCRRDDKIAVEEKKMHMFEEETEFQGKHIVWQTTKTSIKTSDGRQLMVGISLDITNKILAYQELQEAKEKAEQSNRLKSAFLANMSHEIRTPLNAIVGFSELMIETTDANEKEEYSHIINTNNELLLRLISDILDLSKIEAGMLELKPTQFDVAILYNDLSKMFEKRINNKEIQFVCENPYKSCLVEFDRNRLIQVITNFVTNAIKFTSRGQIKMGYEYVDGGLKVFVSDSGIGIPKDKIEKVFERFEKLDNFAQGTGLGMAICKAIIEAHNGKIGVDSEEGKGSTFWAWAPAEAVITK